MRFTHICKSREFSEGKKNMFAVTEKQPVSQEWKQIDMSPRRVFNTRQTHGLEEKSDQGLWKTQNLQFLIPFFDWNGFACSPMQIAKFFYHTIKQANR